MRNWVWNSFIRKTVRVTRERDWNMYVNIKESHNILFDLINYMLCLCYDVSLMRGFYYIIVVCVFLLSILIFLSLLLQSNFDIYNQWFFRYDSHYKDTMCTFCFPSSLYTSSSRFMIHRVWWVSLEVFNALRTLDSTSY